MTQRATVSLLILLLLSPLAPVRAAAQDGDAAPRSSVDLGINFERVKREVEALPSSDEERVLLQLNYYLTVYGRAPRINPLEGFDTITGPVPFGTPTHAAMRDLWTPEEFSTPAADLGSLFDWILKR